MEKYKDELETKAKECEAELDSKQAELDALQKNIV